MLHSQTKVDSVFWQEPELLNWYDDGAKRFSRLGIDIVRSTATTLVAGTATYAYPTRCIVPLYVAHNNKRLKPASTHELEVRDSAYLTTAGTPEWWYVDKVGGVLGTYPVANAAAVTLASSLEVIYARYTPVTDLFENATLPFPAVLGDALTTRAVIDAYAREGDGAAPEISAQLERLWQLYLQLTTAYWGLSGLQ